MRRSVKLSDIPLSDRAKSAMVSSAFRVYPLRMTAHLSLGMMAAGVLLLCAPTQAQELPSEGMMNETETIEPAPLEDLPAVEGVQPVDPSEIRPLTIGDSFLSIQGGKRLLEEASQAISAEDYPQAASKLQEARQVFNQLSNFYQQLAASFSGVDNRIADQHRNQARQTAQMRDDATYQLALVHRAQEQHELAVPLLIQVIRSQAPTRDLGQKAYQQLLELGFVDDPFPKSQPDGQATSSAQ